MKKRILILCLAVFSLADATDIVQAGAMTLGIYIRK
jgi:hypothetical protein